jgi:8-oxo-dGTP diphosphatase
MPVLAAGGIVIRNSGKPLVAIVQRRRDNAWVLPKGKLKPNEKPIAAARREATEETGAEVRVHEFLGVISYVGGSGPKIAHFWRMQAIGGAPGKPMDDIKAVEWLPLSVAIERLTLPHEQFFLRNVGRKALKKTLRKPRRRLAEDAMSAADQSAPPIAATGNPKASVPVVIPPPLRATTAVPRVKLVKPQPPQPSPPQPRWEVLARLTKRWQAAVGRARRIG